MSPDPLPTEAELEILRVLWHRGPRTVREIHDRLDKAEPTGYTTTLKLLQIMHAKGLVSRDTSARSHVYAAAVAREGTERRLLDDLLRRAFDGSIEKLVLRALSDEPASADELRRVQQLLDRFERREES